MGRKGKRRRRPRAQDRLPEARPDQEAEPEAPTEAAAPAPRRRGGLLSSVAIPSPHAPLGESLRRGVPPVADPRVLGVAFLFVLALWGLIVGVGAEAPPSLLVGFWGVPPISVFFNALVLSSIVSGAIASPLGVLVAVLGVRALCLTAIVRWIGGGLGETAEGKPRGFLSASLSMFAVHSAELGLVLIAYTLVGGLLGQQIGALLAWGVGVYFLGFVPAVVALEGTSAAEALRRGLRAARLPGARHLTFVMLYLLGSLWMSQFAPGGPLPPATPTIGMWAYVLVGTAVHLAAIGVLTYRWLAVRDEVPSGPAPRRRRTA